MQYKFYYKSFINECDRNVIHATLKKKNLNFEIFGNKLGIKIYYVLNIMNNFAGKLCSIPINYTLFTLTS